MKTNLLSFILLCSAAMAAATEPTGYYSQCEGLAGRNLLQKLQAVVGDHTNVGYDGLWDLYLESDVTPEGKVWDMYSTKRWTPGREQCGSYKVVGDCYNREHSFPKSWFNDASPMVSDAFHIYPTDGKVNGQRSNYPYGECSGGTRLPSSGGVSALGKLGKSTYPGYSGTVFEPDDEYKGDFARSYFYMAAAYNDRIRSWDSDMLDGTAYPAFTDWAVALLLKWHRQDPVSRKEIDRNEAVYAAQHNRNPFIDHPELAEFIWGDKVGTPWQANIMAEPKLSRPADGQQVDMGVAAIGVEQQTIITVKGVNLTKTLSVAVSGTGFSVANQQIAATAANADEGAQLVVKFKAAAAGHYTGSVTISSPEVRATLGLAVEVVDGLPFEATDISDTEVDLRWVNLGNAYPGGYYRLSVNDDYGTLPGYPLNVSALAQAYTITDLSPETTYYMTLRSQTLTSKVLEVTTLAAIPSISVLYDGELSLQAEPGIPSDPAELILDIENITVPIDVVVSAPFQVSDDLSHWDTSLRLLPGEDRFYLRIFGENVGTYVTTIVMRAGQYMHDDAQAVGSIAAADALFVEDFEPAGDSNYNEKNYQGTACLWHIVNGGFYTGKNNNNYTDDGGAQSLRFGTSSGSSLTMLTDKPNGAGVVSFLAREWSSSDGAATVDLEISTDGGVSWETVGTAQISTLNYDEYRFVVNREGDVCLRVQQTEGRRFLLDNLSITDFRQSNGAHDPECHSWTAYCLDGRLVVDTAVEQTIAIYGLDGTTYADAPLAAGTHSFSLAPGLYIVANAGYARRVLVK